MTREIVIHCLDDARAALGAAAALNVAATLASAPGAASQAGPLWFKALVDAAHAAHPGAEVAAVLDCGDEAGAVMAGLRAGLQLFRFSGAADARTKLSAMGAIFVEPPPARLDLRMERDKPLACRRFLAVC